MDNEQVKSEKIEIPEVVYQGDDKKLKERIYKFKTGSFRIAVFTVVGLFMGFFSSTYTWDSFLPTKIIFSIPYKITEAIYLSVLGTSGNLRWPMYPAWTEFFPHSGPATLLAENVTTLLIGGAIYGSLAYFTGDKRVFTLQRFLKFAGCWCGVILLVIGAAYGINAKALADNEQLRGEPVFYLINGDLGNGMLVGSYVLDDDSVRFLREQLYSGLEPAQVRRDFENEVMMSLDYNYEKTGLFSRIGWYFVNYYDCYLATEQGKTYRISREFAEVLHIYYETGELPENLAADSTLGERLEVVGEEATEE